jgi:enamine deaminase RidA (YjgF/YER057c/UK114 family)
LNSVLHQIFRAGALAAALLVQHLPAATLERREIEPDARMGKASAVVVGDGPLVHTSGFFGCNPRGELVDSGIARQTEQVLANIEQALVAGGSNLALIVKLNLSVREPALCGEVQKILSRKFEGKPKPALTLVVSEQIKPGALVSGDAVGLADAAQAGAGVRWLTSKQLYTGEGQTHVAVLPKGPRIYLSGKGGNGPTRETTRKLLADIKTMMEFADVKPADVVQIRVFLNQMNETPVQADAMREFFGRPDYPPVTYLERAGDGAMEIEMVAAGRPNATRAAAQIEYLTPPKYKASPLFSQIARVNYGGLVYVSGLYGDSTRDPETQAKTIFDRMEVLVRAGGSDMRHLAKALYYITGKEGGVGMDKIRPKAFDPVRPPAASRNNLRHVGEPGGTMLVDMIAVVVAN